MSLLKKLATPKISRKINPVQAALDAKKHGGKPLKAFLDPMDHIFDSGPRSASQAQKAYDNSPEGMKKKKRADAYASAGMTPREGMKCGGKVKMSKGGQCKGGGVARRGMKFGRNG